MTRSIFKQLCLVLAFGVSFAVAACGGDESQELVVEEGKAETLPAHVQISMELDPDAGVMILHDQTANIEWRIMELYKKTHITLPGIASFQLMEGELIDAEISDGARLKRAVLDLVAFYQAQGSAADGEDPESEAARLEQVAEDFAARVKDGINPTTAEFLKSAQGRRLIHETMTGMVAGLLWTVILLEATTVEFVATVGSILESTAGIVGFTSFFYAVSHSFVDLCGNMVGFDLEAKGQTLVLADCDLQECDYSGFDALFEIMM